MLSRAAPGSGTGTFSTSSLKSGPSFTTTPALHVFGISDDMFDYGNVVLGALDVCRTSEHVYSFTIDLLKLDIGVRLRLLYK